MFRGVAGVAVGAVMAIANISPTAASPSAATMREGGYALAPFSFVKFCLDYPGDCPKSAGPGRIHLTSAHMAELANVNRAVNAAIRPTPDTSAMRFWRLNVSAGDCNAFAVEKRHELIRRGWPAAALALTVAKTSWGEGHLVVTVRTDQGDLVLDNLRSTIIAWQKTGYDWIMRQSEANPQFWVDLDGGRGGNHDRRGRIRRRDRGRRGRRDEPDRRRRDASPAPTCRRPRLRRRRRDEARERRTPRAGPDRQSRGADAAGSRGRQGGDRVGRHRFQAGGRAALARRGEPRGRRRGSGARASQPAGDDDGRSRLRAGERPALA